MFHGCSTIVCRAVFSLLLLSLASHAGVPDRKAIDRYLDHEMRRQQIPGAALAILEDGKPIYVKGYGVATLEHAVPVTPATVFQIGSIGKQFTATALMLLARDHELELDDPLSKYLPESPPAWAAVTLRSMLSHRSGIPQLLTPTVHALDLRHEYTDAEYIALAASRPLDFPPGTAVSYSDTAYVLLGLVIDRVSGMFYGDYLRQRVFEPLGMSRTRVISDADIVLGRASGYELDENGRIRNQSPVAVALNRTADGSLYSTVEDLAKWDRALYGERILSHAELARMWSVDPLEDGSRPLYHFGYGWENNRLRGHRLIEYDGNWQGFQGVMSRYTDRGLSVILLTNLSLCRTERLAHTVAGLVDPALRPYGRASHDPDLEATDRFRSFIGALSASDQAGPGDPRPGGVPGAKPSLSLLAGVRRELRELGPVQSLELAQDERLTDGPRRVYRVEGRDMVDFFSVRYTADGDLADVDLFQEY